MVSIRLKTYSSGQIAIIRTLYINNCCYFLSPFSVWKTLSRLFPVPTGQNEAVSRQTGSCLIRPKNPLKLELYRKEEVFMDEYKQANGILDVRVDDRMVHGIVSTQ